MLLRRLALTAVALAPALLAAPAVSAAPLPLPQLENGGDHLTVAVSEAGRLDGRYELYCHPDGGTHHRPKEACAQLDKQARWGKDLFAPVAKNQVCTDIYGGPQRAHISGRWAGKPVDADFNRTNGCEMERWNKFSELLGNPEVSDED
ncbi:SSI family serine proteinase inhibitor [Streptomyces sp. NPDC051162]|uniref:SSI family serine proteinase inhibitor n=1 Tax=unclassified Streptomyces TaxID=2593676 RepID=UPI0034296E5D